MIDLAKLWSEIEAEQTWRVDELRFFQNQIASLVDDLQKDQFRRALILLLYAHYEGFCKFALTLYVNTINATGIACGSLNTAIAAASMHTIFRELRDPSSKSSLFSRKLPDDAKLHRFARDKEFVENMQAFESKPVTIPDDLIDMESNLKPAVLRKNLFQLGLKHDQFESIEGAISKLLNYRNRIAHGETKEGIRSETYNDLRTLAINIMTTIKRDIMQAIQEEHFLRASSN